MYIHDIYECKYKCIMQIGALKCTVVIGIVQWKTEKAVIHYPVCKKLYDHNKNYLWQKRQSIVSADIKGKQIVLKVPFCV